MFFSKSTKTLLIALVALMLAGFSYAYANANTVDATAAGDGSAAISGFTVTSVKYNLNSTNPSNIDTVTFTITPAASTVKITLDGGTTWFTCNGAVAPVSCTTTGATVSSAMNLKVVATNN